MHQIILFIFLLLVFFLAADVVWNVPAVEALVQSTAQSSTDIVKIGELITRR